MPTSVSVDEPQARSTAPRSVPWSCAGRTSHSFSSPHERVGDDPSMLAVNATVAAWRLIDAAAHNRRDC
jgi:hypothetical protein